MSNHITYKGFLVLIERMVERKESGTLYIHTDGNHSILVGVRNGNIDALIAGPKSGLEAISMIRQMASGSYQRSGVVPPFPSTDLPDTSDILLLLKESKKAPAEQQSSGPSPVPDPQIDSELAGKILCDLLHDYLGPVAPIICEDVTEKGAKIRTSIGLESAIRSLAKEIDSSAEAANFIVRARNNLRKFLF